MSDKGKEPETEIRSIVDGRIISMELEDAYQNAPSPLVTPTSSPVISEGEETQEYSSEYSEEAYTKNVKKWTEIEHDPRYFRDTGRFSLEIRPLNVNPEAAFEYFLPLFMAEDLIGKITLTSKSTFGDEWIHFNFTGMCPLHRKDHLGDYGDWRYTVRRGKYAGFKCWSGNEWRTTYKFEDLDLLINI